MLTRLNVVIILQHIQALNHYVGHLKLILGYLSIIPQLKNEKKPTFTSLPILVSNRA